MNFFVWLIHFILAVLLIFKFTFPAAICHSSAFLLPFTEISLSSVCFPLTSVGVSYRHQVLQYSWVFLPYTQLIFSYNTESYNGFAHRKQAILSTILTYYLDGEESLLRSSQSLSSSRIPASYRIRIFTAVFTSPQLKFCTYFLSHHASCMNHICPHTWSDCVFGEECKLRSSSWHNVLQSPVTSCSRGPSIVTKVYICITWLRLTLTSSILGKDIKVTNSTYRRPSWEDYNHSPC